MELTRADKLSIEGLASTLSVRLIDEREARYLAGSDWYILTHFAQGISMSSRIEETQENVTFLNPRNTLATTPDRYYFMALHELGHHGCGHLELDKSQMTDRQITACEREAWQWALDHANRPATPDVLRYMDMCLGTYEAEERKAA